MGDINQPHQDTTPQGPEQNNDAMQRQPSASPDDRSQMGIDSLYQWLQKGGEYLVQQLQSLSKQESGAAVEAAQKGDVQSTNESTQSVVQQEVEQQPPAPEAPVQRAQSVQQYLQQHFDLGDRAIAVTPQGILRIGGNDIKYTIGEDAAMGRTQVFEDGVRVKTIVGTDAAAYAEAGEYIARWAGITDRRATEPQSADADVTDAEPSSDVEQTPAPPSQPPSEPDAAVVEQTDEDTSDALQDTQQTEEPESPSEDVDDANAEESDTVIEDQTSEVSADVPEAAEVDPRGELAERIEAALRQHLTVDGFAFRIDENGIIAVTDPQGQTKEYRVTSYESNGRTSYDLYRDGVHLGGGYRQSIVEDPAGSMRWFHSPEDVARGIGHFEHMPTAQQTAKEQRETQENAKVSQEVIKQLRTAYSLDGLTVARDGDVITVTNDSTGAENRYQFRDLPPEDRFRDLRYEVSINGGNFYNLMRADGVTNYLRTPRDIVMGIARRERLQTNQQAKEAVSESKLGRERATRIVKALNDQYNMEGYTISIEPDNSIKILDSNTRWIRYSLEPTTTQGQNVFYLAGVDDTGRHRDIGWGLNGENFIRPEDVVRGIARGLRLGWERQR